MKLLLLFLSLSAFADVGREVFIRGKVGNEFNEEKVKVTDSIGQTYFLPKRLFPKDFKFIQGQSFAIEVDEKELDQVKILKK
jgi:hypothetical protein